VTEGQAVIVIIELWLIVCLLGGIFLFGTRGGN
jgi:hypothetical protein